MGTRTRTCPGCGGLIYRSSRQCRACRNTERRSHMLTGQSQWQNRCRCGQLKAKSSDCCAVCRRGVPMAASYVRKDGLRVQTNPSEHLREFQVFLMNQRCRIRQAGERAVERVYRARKESDDIAQISRQAGTTLARTLRGEVLTVEMRGNASGHATGRRSPLLAEERVSEKYVSNYTTKDGFGGRLL